MRSQMSNSETVKAQRAIVRIGNLEVEGFMLPDGSYRMPLSQATECVGLQARNAFDFLRSKTFKQLMGQDYTVPISEVESVEVMSKYWNWKSHCDTLIKTVALIAQKQVPLIYLVVPKANSMQSELAHSKTKFAPMPVQEVS